MRWTIPLTALAIETRYRYARLTAKYARKNSDTKKIKALWEDTVHTFLQRAMSECAWGDEDPRVVTVSQFINKLNLIRAAFKAKQTFLLTLTGNRVEESETDGDEGDDEQRRQYP